MIICFNFRESENLTSLRVKRAIRELNIDMIICLKKHVKIKRDAPYLNTESNSPLISNFPFRKTTLILHVHVSMDLSTSIGSCFLFKSRF